MDRPILAITMGDPAGCGPEITVKALRKPEVFAMCRPLVVGDANVFERTLRMLADVGVVPAGEFTVHRVKDPAEGIYQPGTIDVLHFDLIDMDQFEWGKLSAQCGEAAFVCVTEAIRLAMEGKVDGTVTNALNKEAINLAGHHYSGHTEIYADYTHTRDYAMMLAHGDLRVIHVSTHVALREACDRVKKDRILTCIRLADEECRRQGVEHPRLAVAGLNPHAGEHGLFGREEIDEIIPAIEEARRQGYDVTGPEPPDSLFSKARGGWYDCVVAMYHDQGHIPLKVVGFEYDREKQAWKAVQGVNITLGLPIIRVSVDHGTAFDTSGRGIQNEDSLVNSIEFAARSAAGRKKE